MKITDRKAFESALRRKVGVYRGQDKKKGRETATFSEFMSMVDACSGTCPRCSCAILFEGYQPYCFYQYSFDRLDNDKGHVLDNLEIVCWYCNSLDSTKDISQLNRKKPKCIQACHGFVFVAAEAGTHWRCARCGKENDHGRYECTEKVDVDGIVLNHCNWYVSRHSE